MGKKLKLEDPKTGKVEWVDEDNIGVVTYEECVKRGDFGRNIKKVKKDRFKKK